MALNWSAWGPPIQTWAFGGALAAVQFKNLGLYNRILMEFEAVLPDAGTPDLAAQVSEDNGITWVNGAGNYVRWGVGLTAQTSIIMTTAVGVANPTSGMLIINSFNATRKATLGINGGRDGASSGLQQMGGRVDRAIARSAVQAIWSTGANFAAGVINLYGIP